MNDYAKERVKTLVSQLEAQGYNQMAARIDEAAEDGYLQVNFVSVKNGTITRGVDTSAGSGRKMSTTFEVTVTTL